MDPNFVEKVGAELTRTAEKLRHVLSAAAE